MPLKQIDGSFHKHIFEARYNFSIECCQNRIQVVVQIFLAFSITHARFPFCCYAMKVCHPIHDNVVCCAIRVYQRRTADNGVPVCMLFCV